MIATAGRNLNLIRRLVVILSLAAFVLAALSPASPGFVWAVIVPILLFAGFVAVAAFDRNREESAVPALPCLSVIASRAPPSC